MANDDEKPSERLRSLYQRFCAEDLYWRRYFERSLAETARLAKLRHAASAPIASTMTEDA
jgi:hypothetical protein